MLNLERKINEVLGPAADMVCPLPATDTTLEHKNPNPRAKVFTEVMAEGLEFDRQGLITSATLCTMLFMALPEILQL